MDSTQADKVAQFTAVTGANPSTAQTTLESSNWNLEEAVSLFYAASEDPAYDHDEEFQSGDDEQLKAATAAATQSSTPSSSHAPPPTSQPQSSSAPKPRRTPGQGPRAVTLRDLQQGEDDDDDDSDPDKKPDLFAGGEKSALAVQNPDRAGGPVDHFRNIMNQARQNRSRPDDGEEGAEQTPARTSAFAGRAQTLGGDDAPSQIIADPTQNTAATNARAGARPAMPRVTRTLHLWSDGVSIDDGLLFRFDDPANAGMMEQIHAGRAPLSLLSVEPNQEVDLNLVPHKDEKYVKPKTVYKPFGGGGNRLGSPVPSPSGGSSAPVTAAPAAPAAAASNSTASTGPKATDMPIDTNTPTIQLQIRLGDGTQLRSRFNTTHTVGDVYDFVDRATSTPWIGRDYALMTTFPSRELTDKKQMLGEMGEYKRGGVVVQKWT
ncbi:hypothetical protein LTR62_008466 [Meristemomyces frigidus]|uniref:Uncharacterized protein n=1 Tax=Meristemomyces frigidus TaxID=1508187 RepID=A0AAN7TMU6_9PEZI|nr:hypothetical protein LTR62_008466 [Meristemomyces frigidus]